MNEPAVITFAEIEVGQKAHFEVRISEDLVARFAEVSGDTNPLHMDEAYATTTSFGGRIAHGMLGASFFSKLVGMHLPGRHALYLSQKISFRKPCRIGMLVTVEGEVLQKVTAAKAVTLSTRVLDEEGVCLIDGEAMVAMLV